MSYRTNALGRRLSYKTLWNSNTYFKNKKDFLIDFRLKEYIKSIFYTTIKPAAKNQHTKTNSKLGYRPKAHPVIVGEIQILRKISSIFLVVNYFLMEEGVHSKTFNRLQWKILKSQIFLEKLLYSKIYFLFNNYYHYVLNANVFFHRKKYIRILARKLILKNFSKSFGQKFQNLYLKLGESLKLFEQQFSRYKRNNYFERIFFPLISLFYMNKFDVELLAKIIALELQTLRKFHVPFLDFVYKLLKTFFHNLNVSKILGIQVFVKGRMTFYRRQVRRKQKKIYNIGLLKRSLINSNSTSHSEISYNRFGLMNVTVTVHEKKFTNNSEMDFFWNFFNEETIKSDSNFELIIKKKNILENQLNNINLSAKHEFKDKKNLYYNINFFYKNNIKKHFDLFRYRKYNIFNKYHLIHNQMIFTTTKFINEFVNSSVDVLNPLQDLSKKETKSSLSQYQLPLSENKSFKNQKKNFNKWLYINKKKLPKNISKLLNSWKYNEHHKRIKWAREAHDKFIEIIYRPQQHVNPVLPLIEKKDSLSFLVGLKKTIFYNKLSILRTYSANINSNYLKQFYPKRFILCNFFKIKFYNFFIFVFFLIKRLLVNFSLKKFFLLKTITTNKLSNLYKNSITRLSNINSEIGSAFLIRKEFESVFCFFMFKQFFSSMSILINNKNLLNFYKLNNKSMLKNRILKNKFWKEFLKKYLNNKDMDFKRDPSLVFYKTTKSLIIFKNKMFLKKKLRKQKKIKKRELRSKK